MATINQFEKNLFTFCPVRFKKIGSRKHIRDGGDNNFSVLRKGMIEKSSCVIVYNLWQIFEQLWI